MEEIASVTPQYGGMSYDRLEKGGLQWSCPEANHPGTPILHVEKFNTATSKAQLMLLSYRPSAELPDNKYQLMQATDRSLFHYHTGSMTI